MPNYNSTSRTPFAKGGRVAFKASASEKMKSEVAEAARKREINHKHSTFSLEVVVSINLVHIK